jgi:hypothetical protein
MTVRPVVAWRCHICGAEFNELGGGLCAACNRPTCAACWGDHRAFLPGKQRTRRCKTCSVLQKRS